MKSEFEVGPQYGGTGTRNDTARIGVSGAGIVTDAHGHFFEAVRLGTNGTGQGVWSATTAAAGVAPGTALSTTPPFALWNPPNSGVLASILVTRLGYVSGTWGAGTLAYAYVSSQLAKPSTGTALTPNSQLLASQTTSRIQAFQGSTVSATPTLLAPAFSFGAILATTTFQPDLSKDIVDGEIVVAPGGVFVMQAIATAGTTPLALLGATWEEVPYLL